MRSLCMPWYTALLVCLCLCLAFSSFIRYWPSACKSCENAKKTRTIFKCINFNGIVVVYLCCCCGLCERVFFHMLMFEHCTHLVKINYCEFRPKRTDNEYAIFVTILTLRRSSESALKVMCIRISATMNKFTRVWHNRLDSEKKRKRDRMNAKTRRHTHTANELKGVKVDFVQPECRPINF